MSAYEPEGDADRRLLAFVGRMRRIPRRALRCEIYGTVRAVLDDRAAARIFARVSPAASRDAIYAARIVLQDRLDGESDATG